MRVVLHGVRGSTPATGRDFLRVGGHTSCVAITPAGHASPTLLLDAGTGLRSVSESINGAAFHGHILLTHLHWDHVQGLPFFAAGDRKDSQVHLMLPAQLEASSKVPGSAAALLGRAMSPPHFPIGPDGLHGRWSFSAIEPGRFSAGDFDVTAREVPHKGGRTYGYRVEADGMSIAYIPDHHPSSDGRPALLLAKDVDVLCHGAMFASEQQDIAHAYGHATINEAHQLANQAGVGRLVLIHHAPGRTDDEVDALANTLDGSGVTVVVGREHDVVLDHDEMRV